MKKIKDQDDSKEWLVARKLFKATSSLDLNIIYGRKEKEGVEDFPPHETTSVAKPRVYHGE